MISITNKIFSMLSFFIGIALIVFVVGIQGQSFNEAVVLGILLILNGAVRLFFSKSS